MSDTPNPSGTNTPQTTAEEVLDVMEPGEPYTTPEIQEELDLTQSTAYRRLRDLADEGKIRKKKAGSRTVIWIRDGGAGGE
jgi:uncharacterized membrane protein